MDWVLILLLLVLAYAVVAGYLYLRKSAYEREKAARSGEPGHDETAKKELV